MTTILFESERCYLRPFQTEDLEIFLAYRQDKEVERYQGWKDYTLDEAQQFIEWATQSSLESGKTQWALILKETEAMMGDIYLNIESTHLDLGFTLAVAYQKKGYMTEILSILIPALLKRYSLPIRCDVNPHNKASLQLCERLGMRVLSYEDDSIILEKKAT